MPPLCLLVLFTQAVISKDVAARSRSSRFVEDPVKVGAGRQQRVARLIRSNARRRLQMHPCTNDAGTGDTTVQVPPIMIAKRDPPSNNWFWCIFPFKYQGVCHYDFTSDGGTRPWCSTKTNTEFEHITNILPEFENIDGNKGYKVSSSTVPGSCSPGTSNKVECNWCVCDSLGEQSQCTDYDCTKTYPDVSSPTANEWSEVRR